MKLRYLVVWLRYLDVKLPYLVVWLPCWVSYYRRWGDWRWDWAASLRRRAGSSMAIGWARGATYHYRHATVRRLVSLLLLALHRQDREQVRPQRANNK